MTGVKISALPAIAAPAASDVFPVVQSGVTYQETITQLATIVASNIPTNSVTNAMLAQMPTLTILGNNTGGTANAAYLTVSQVNTMLGTTPSTPGQLPGTTTNDNAAAGNVGEFITSNIPVASAVSLTTATPTDITSINLSAGDFDVWANIFFDSSGQDCGGTAWTSLVSATPIDRSLISQGDMSVAVINCGIAVSPRRYSLAAPATVYLSVNSNFGSGTLTACGFISARRAR